jgi:hypothetical protein
MPVIEANHRFVNLAGEPETAGVNSFQKEP